MGTKYDLFEKRNIEYKVEISKMVRRYATKMSAPLVFCSSLLSIHIKKIFQMVIYEAIGRAPNFDKVKQIHVALEKPLFEWNHNYKYFKEESKIFTVFGFIRRINNKHNKLISINGIANIVCMYYGIMKLWETKNNKKNTKKMKKAAKNNRKRSRHKGHK